jgi:hypothetical protein
MMVTGVFFRDNYLASHPEPDPEIFISLAAWLEAYITRLERADQYACLVMRTLDHLDLIHDCAPADLDFPDSPWYIPEAGRS